VTRYSEYRVSRPVGLGAPPKPVTVVRLDLPDFDIEREAREAAGRVAERRIIRTGRDAWEEIGKTASLPAWYRIGAALAIGKACALKITGANAAWGQNYSREFGLWMRANGFGSMPKATRSWAVALHENAAAIEQWRLSLPERQRKRLVNPQSVVRRWQRETQRHTNGKCSTDLQREARAAWKRFVWCLRSLPAHEAAPLWQAALAEVAALAHA
jgi:hypothetical protein